MLIASCESFTEAKLKYLNTNSIIIFKYYLCVFILKIIIDCTVNCCINCFVNCCINCCINSLFLASSLGSFIVVRWFVVWVLVTLCLLVLFRVKLSSGCSALRSFCRCLPSREALCGLTLACFAGPPCSCCSAFRRLFRGLVARNLLIIKSSQMKK